MGAQVSKTAGNGETAAEKAGEPAAASPSKANGQVTVINPVISQENWFNHVVFNYRSSAGDPHPTTTRIMPCL